MNNQFLMSVKMKLQFTTCTCITIYLNENGTYKKRVCLNLNTSKPLFFNVFCGGFPPVFIRFTHTSLCCIFSPYDFFLSFFHLSLDIMWDNRIFYHKNKMNMVCVIFQTSETGIYIPVHVLCCTNAVYLSLFTCMVLKIYQSPFQKLK